MVCDKDDKECRAKNPSKCRVHGAKYQELMNAKFGFSPEEGARYHHSGGGSQSGASGKQGFKEQLENASKQLGFEITTEQENPKSNKTNNEYSNKHLELPIINGEDTKKWTSKEIDSKVNEIYNHLDRKHVEHYNNLIKHSKASKGIKSSFLTKHATVRAAQRGFTGEEIKDIIEQGTAVSNDADDTFMFCNGSRTINRNIETGAIITVIERNW